MQNLGLHNLYDGLFDGGNVPDARGDRPRFAPRQLGPSRSGITLIELLVVISILMLLAAVAVPAVRPALEGRRIREAARAVNVYLGAAQGEAMRTGRPCGVILERVDGLPQCSMVLHQAIVPPPYAGDDLNSAVRLRHVNEFSINAIVEAYLIGGFNPGLVHVGDRIQFNYQGPWFQIHGPDIAPVDGIIDSTVGPGGEPLKIKIHLGDHPHVPWPKLWLAQDSPEEGDAKSAPLPYQIRRRPIKSSAKPLQLPAGAVIDLTASGTDLQVQRLGWHGNWAKNDPEYQYAQSPPVIMFSPNGSVERMDYVPLNPATGEFEPVMFDPDVIDFDGGDLLVLESDLLVTRPIYLMIGKRERVTNEEATDFMAEEDMPNWTDLTNLWITINPQTGLVSTAENHFVEYRRGDPTVDGGRPIAWSLPDRVWPFILAARRTARESQSMGGR
ncbi:MAG: prepilin-type N-terminal cleavage/methylation domain-containing protein [Thermoguttaceae bacterium]